MAQVIAAVIIKGLGVAASSVAATLIGGAVQLGLGLALSAVFGAKKPTGTGAQPQDGRELFTETVGARVIQYGPGLVGGQVVFGRAADGRLHRVIVHCQGPISAFVEMRLNGRQYTLEPDGRVLEAPFNTGEDGSLVRVETRPGQVPSAAYSGPADAAPEWGAAHRLDGLATTWIRLEQRSAGKHQESYPNGATKLQWLIDGVKVHDPRMGQDVYTDNAMLVIADWLARDDGFGEPDALDEAEVIAQADKADASRPLLSGGTTRKWRLAGRASLAVDPEQELRGMLDAVGGDLRLRPDGKISVEIGGDPDPVITLTDDDVLEFLEGDDGRDALDRYTVLPATYVDETLDFVQTTADPWISADEEARLGESIEAGPLDLRWSPNHSQTREALQIRSIRDNPPERQTIRFKISALPAIYERTVMLDIATLGLSGTWRVMPTSISTSDLTITMTLFKLRDRPAWTVASEGAPQAMPPEQPDPQNPPSAPTGVQASRYGDGSVAGIFVAYDAPVAEDTDHYVVHRRQGTSDWVSVPTGGAQTGAHITGLVDAALYDIAIIAARTVSYDPDASTVTDTRVLGVAAGPQAEVPAAPTALAVSDAGGGTAVVTVTASASAFGRWTDILRDGVRVARLRSLPSETLTHPDNSGAGSFDWTARAVSLTDIETADTAAVSQTIT